MAEEEKVEDGATRTGTNVLDIITKIIFLKIGVVIVHSNFEEKHFK